VAITHTRRVQDPASSGESEAPEEPRPRLTGLFVTLAAIAALGALIVSIEPLRDGVGEAVTGDTGALRAEIRALDFAGVLIVLALAVAHAVVWYPAEILDAAVGFVYDFWVALPLMMFGWLLNALVAYWIGRHAARPVLWRLAGRERFERLERLVESGGVTLLLAMRLIPVVPFSLFSIVAGAAHAPLVPFLWTSVVGYLPLTALFVYLGSQLEELSPTDPILWGGAAVLVALLLLTRRFRNALREPA
jgi:uncharacterized membrane protein YdjX (TVP38/TMEM64 family)